ncbi:hypothetical protein M0R88_16370 [Halorussus gelatinilyticus]|uniref:Halobacterial output domain-containing protein n=1 Tax=Halorussus gelatinilyticus TaxID=2937524 RepID=A0A8U0IHA6_9EURY|nr:HalOD1 output domain-containing protein [Halorussus gelatinilyticus]UPW00076.1 hypothetical protein M0R88_16370 [Halorussus gelatinilyticus]
MNDPDATYTSESAWRHRTTERTPSEAVVLAVADARNCDPVELPPLNDTLDPDALDALFAETVAGRPRTGGRITFEYDDCTVAVFGSGEVLVKVDD